MSIKKEEVQEAGDLSQEEEDCLNGLRKEGKAEASQKDTEEMEKKGRNQETEVKKTTRNVQNVNVMDVRKKKKK